MPFDIVVCAVMSTIDMAIIQMISDILFIGKNIKTPIANRLLPK